jgi:hypothetical protein
MNLANILVFLQNSCIYTVLCFRSFSSQYREILGEHEIYVLRKVQHLERNYICIFMTDNLTRNGNNSIQVVTSP